MHHIDFHVAAVERFKFCLRYLLYMSGNLNYECNSLYFVCYFIRQYIHLNCIFLCFNNLPDNFFRLFSHYGNIIIPLVGIYYRKVLIDPKSSSLAEQSQQFKVMSHQVHLFSLNRVGYFSCFGFQCLRLIQVFPCPAFKLSGPFQFGWQISPYFAPLLPAILVIYVKQGIACGRKFIKSFIKDCPVI